MPKKTIQLSDHFTYSRLLRFVLPCIGTMLFTSIYGIVDGLCVSNFVGKTAFAAVNLIMPLPQLLGTVGFMLGTGGSAIVGITLGEGDQKKCRPLFYYVSAGGACFGQRAGRAGLCVPAAGRRAAGRKGRAAGLRRALRAHPDAGAAALCAAKYVPKFFRHRRKPLLGFWFTVGAGCTNMVLDVVMVGMLHWGVEGAAVATLISQLVAACCRCSILSTTAIPAACTCAERSFTAACCGMPASTALPS